VVEDCIAPGRDSVQRARRLSRPHFADALEALPHPPSPERSIGIQEDVFGAFIVQQRQKLVAKLAL
jgi:hypothetical protein